MVMRAALPVFLLGALLPTSALAQEPIRVVEESLTVPANLDPEVALQSVADIPQIFELYQPIIPWVPGVKLDLSKEVVSADAPVVLELPVSGTAVGKSIEERAHVTATSKPTSCSGGRDGRKITLDFHQSTYNIERRIDRIEITACLDTAPDGTAAISAVGRMYAGYKPEDPNLNPVTEAIGARALEGAFIRQVSAVLVAVQRHWSQLG
jgi:hypothetical protein